MLNDVFRDGRLAAAATKSPPNRFRVLRLDGPASIGSVRTRAKLDQWGIVDSNHGPRSYQDRALTT